MIDRAPAQATAGSQRVRIDLGYDGTDFHGWAIQPGLRTVEGELGRALATVLRAPVRLIVAGRTDAGVHATGQVAHADLAAAPPTDLRRHCNGVLPADVRVHRVGPAAPGFDARFAALSRIYRYRVTDTVPDPLRRRDTLAYPRRLDLDRLQDASRRLLGEHDFTAYCKHRPGGTTIRRLLRLDWQRVGDVLVATVQADAFCHTMVRSLVGALLAVGDRRHPVDRPAALLRARQRGSAITLAPARGLTLVEVCYPPDDELPVRVARTRTGSRRTNLI